MSFWFGTAMTLSAGCGGDGDEKEPEGEDTEDTEDTEVTDTDTDTVVDTDTVIVTDTGTSTTDTATLTDTSTWTTDTSTTDTATLPTHDGTYTGSVSIMIQAGAIGDTCSGLLTVTIDEASVPQITGSGSCMAAFIGVSMPLTVTGDITKDPTANGILEIDTGLVGLLSGQWTGQFVGDNLTGMFADSIPGVATYSGDLSVDR
jgi:hypothetical protein